MYLKNLLPLVALALLFACESSEKSSNNADSEESDTQAQENMEVPAVSIWDKVSVRAAPSEDGKWLTSLSLGETLTYLGKDSTVDDKTYLLVRLKDETEGWSRTEFVIPEAEAAVFLNDTDIYNRPDLLTKTENQFSKMDIVAVKNTQDDWAEIVGKPTGEKWLKSGWVKASNLSKEDVDIAMAKFAKPILSIKKPSEKVSKLEEILNNQDLTASKFTPDIKEMLDEIKFNQEDMSSDTITVALDSASIN